MTKDSRENRLRICHNAHPYIIRHYDQTVVVPEIIPPWRLWNNWAELANSRMMTGGQSF